MQHIWHCTPHYVHGNSVPSLWFKAIVTLGLGSSHASPHGSAIRELAVPFSRSPVAFRWAAAGVLSGSAAWWGLAAKRASVVAVEIGLLFGELQLTRLNSRFFFANTAWQFLRYAAVLVGNRCGVPCSKKPQSRCQPQS